MTETVGLWTGFCLYVYDYDGLALGLGLGALCVWNMYAHELTE